MRLIYKNRGNQILQGEFYHYLRVGGAYFAFDGELSRMRDGERKTVADWMISFIEKGGAFRECSGRFPINSQGVRLEEALLAVYLNVPFADAKQTEARVGFPKRFTISGLSDDEEQAMFHNHPVFDLTINNIRGAGYGAAYTTNTTVYHDGRSIHVRCKGAEFQTGYDAGLYGLMRRVPTWNVNDQGRLKVYLSGRKIVPSSELIWAYHHSLIGDDPNVRKAMLEAHKRLRSQKVEIDHLSDRVENQYISLLAAMSALANHQIANRRSRIREPYYFWTVYDLNAKQYRVEAGIVSAWSKRFVFENLADEKEAARYVACFREFYDLAKKADHLLTEPNGENLLHYWSAPERMQDCDNPLNALLLAPANSFGKYSVESFADLPIAA